MYPRWLLATIVWGCSITSGLLVGAAIVAAFFFIRGC